MPPVTTQRYLNMSSAENSDRTRQTTLLSGLKHCDRAFTRDTEASVAVSNVASFKVLFPSLKMYKLYFLPANVSYMRNWLFLLEKTLYIFPVLLALSSAFCQAPEHLLLFLLEQMENDEARIVQKGYDVDNLNI